jgi:hypothetical protein
MIHVTHNILTAIDKRDVKFNLDNKVIIWPLSRKFQLKGVSMLKAREILMQARRQNEHLRMFDTSQMIVPDYAILNIGFGDYRFILFKASPGPYFINKPEEKWRRVK